MVTKLKMRKLILWFALLMLFAGLVWAGEQLLNRTNDNASKAASEGAQLEMANIEATTVKPKKTDNIAWGKIQQYERQLKQNTKEYQSLIVKANTEKTANNGNVNDATKQAGMNSAKKFNEISELLAATWQKGNCISRAKTVREAGKSRIANAEMAFNSLSGDAISNYNKQSGLMSEANSESLKEIKEDSSQQDIDKLKANLIPQLNKMIAENTRLFGQIGELLNQVRQAAGGDVSAIAGCAKGIVSGAADGPQGLLRPVMALMDMVKGMGSNMVATLKAISAL